MARYLIEVGYTPESWSNQIHTHANVVDRITPSLEACGGKLECIYYAFGDADLIGIIDFADPTDAAAWALTVTASGALRMFKTTQLLTVDQGIAAMRKADKARANYTPPLTVSLNEGAFTTA